MTSSSTFKAGDRVRVLRTRDTERRDIADLIGVVEAAWRDPGRWKDRGAEWVRVEIRGGSYTIGRIFVEPLETAP